MTMPHPATLRHTAASLLAAAFLTAGAGCKPAPPTGDTATRQPSADDTKNFVRSLLPPTIRLSDFKADAPVRRPNTAPDGNAWTVSFKVTLTPNEDLLAPASLEQAHAFYAPISDLDDLKAWRNTYVRSIYARTYGAFDLPALAPPANLLLVQQAKDKPLAPIYGKLAAEWQVDHWKLDEADLESPPLGQSRAMFGKDPTLVLGSPEAEAVAEAQRTGTDEFRRKRAAVEDRYAKDLAAATKPGTTYRGQIKHPNGVLPCEVHFVETAGAADPQTVAFEVRLPQDPAYLYVFKAKFSPEIPLNIASGAAYQSVAPATSDTNTDPPVGNVTATYVRGTGKLATYGNWPGVLVNGAIRLSYGGTPLVLLGGHMRGVVGEFNGDYTLDAEQITH